IAGAASSGRLLGRLGQRRLFGVMALLLGGGQAIIGFSTSVPATLAGAAIAGLAGGMVLPTLINTVISQVPLSVRSTAIGLVYSTAYLGEFLNPVLLDPIRRAIGIHGVFISVGLVVATIGIGVFIAGRSPAKPPLQR
ncbi:MAG: MFS transporter, partial [Sphingomonadaceae bacterium]|nr:MFS transporter [Sphingomonadaceae bacterium]